MGDRWRGQKALAPYPLRNLKTCADFSGIPRIFGLDGHRYFLMGDMGASGEDKGHLAPS